MGMLEGEKREQKLKIYLKKNDRKLVKEIDMLSPGSAGFQTR